MGASSVDHRKLLHPPVQSQTHQCIFLIHKYRNLHVRCLPLREDSMPKLQRLSEVNIVLPLAGGDSRVEISTMTDGQNALHTAEVNEFLNMDKFGVVEVLDRPQSQQVLSTRWVSIQETGWILQSETCGARI